MRTIKAVETAASHKLITGVAISVCKSNFEMALSEDFINLLHAKGVIYLWYYIYRPTGENPHYELALSAEEIQKLREFMVEGRTRFPLVIIDSYWGAEGEPFCPAVEGLSHHINSSGAIEPCPVIQFSNETVDGTTLKEIYEESAFLRNFKTEVGKKTKGCILMENPYWLQEFSKVQGAHNTSNRNNLEEELAKAPQIPSHGSCPKIPEKNWIYKFAKRHAFFGLGAYG
jgi:MoaA/NifB/PqqE/SkfB family radical SAM enzyme